MFAPSNYVVIINIKEYTTLNNYYHIIVQCSISCSIIITTQLLSKYDHSQIRNRTCDNDRLSKLELLSVCLRSQVSLITW